MCYALYVGSNRPLPEREWGESAPDFNTTRLTDRDEEVRERFSLPFVLYVGAHTGCSCGFQFDEFDDMEEQARVMKTRRALFDFLNTALADDGRLEMFLCWEGGQGEPYESRTTLTPGDFLKQEFPLPEQGFAEILPDPAG